MSQHIQIQVRAGTDVAGHDISPELREWLWPGVTDEEFVDAFRAWMRQRFREVIVARLSQGTIEQAEQLIADGLTDVD